MEKILGSQLIMAANNSQVNPSKTKHVAQEESGKPSNADLESAFAAGEDEGLFKTEDENVG